MDPQEATIRLKRILASRVREELIAHLHQTVKIRDELSPKTYDALIKALSLRLAVVVVERDGIPF